MHVWRAVRCCCSPNKVLGFMLVDEHASEVVVENKWERITRKFSLRLMQERKEISYRAFLGGEAPIHSEPQPYPTRELAIYSEDHPIEFWRNQKGFIEAREI